MNQVISSLIRAIQIPELDESRKELEKKEMQEYAATTQRSYLEILEILSHLSPNDIALIKKARKACIDAGLSLSSASDQGADDLIEAIGTDTQHKIIEYAKEATTAGSDLYTRGLEELKLRMTRGHELATTGAILKDGDPVANTVIWGHTKGLQPKATIHFVFCHFLERAISFALMDSTYPKTQEFGRGKDYFLNAMNDVIRLETARGNGYKEISEKWLATRENGGLQWSNTEKQKMYNQVI